MAHRVAVIGVGHTNFSSITPGMEWKELMYEACQRAYMDAGVNVRKDVDSFITCAEDFWEGFRTSLGNIASDVGLSSDGNIILASCFDGFLYSFEKSGKERWQFRVGSEVWSASVASYGRLMSSSSMDKIFCLDFDGKMLWSFTVAGQVFKTAVSDNGDRLVAGSDDRKVYCFSKSGRMLWKQETKGVVRTIAISDKGERVAVASGDRFIYYYDEKGKKLWDYNTRVGACAIAIAGEGELVAFIGLNNTIYCHDHRGKFKWQHRLDSDTFCLKFSANGKRLAVGNGEYIEVFHV